MSQNIRLKRSSVPGRVPTINQLDLGELALNTYDGKLYLKQDISGVQSVITVGESASFATSASYALTASFFSGSIPSATSASYALTASYANNSTSASYSLTASYWSGSISNAESASYALTASFASNVSSNISSSLSGSIGYLPVFVGSNTLNNSIVYQGQNGIGINTDSFNSAHEALRVFQP